MKFYQALTWKFLQSTYGAFAKKYFNIECIKLQEEPDTPFILLANHSYHTDPFFIGAFLKKPLHYIGSDEIASLPQQLLGKLVGLIYIKKGLFDSMAVRKLVKSVKSGDSIGFFPEGDGSWDGETDKISENLIKLVRLLNVPVVTVNAAGAYLTKSRWASNVRRGRITLRFRVIDLNKIKRLDDHALCSMIRDHLYNNDIKNSEVQKTVFRGNNLAEGIQYLVWKCPVCGAEDTIDGNKNRMNCVKCNSDWSLDGNLRVFPAIKGIHDLKDWSDWQKQSIIDAVNVPQGGVLAKTSGVTLKMFNRYGGFLNRKKMIFDEYSTGEIILEKENLSFVPFDNVKNKMVFNIRAIKSYVDCNNKFFRFGHEKEIYQLLFNGKNSSKYIRFLKELQDLV